MVLALTLGACGTIPENDPLRPADANGESAASTSTRPSAAAPSEAASTTGAESCEYEPTGDAARSARPPSPTGVATSGAVGYDLEMTEGTVRIVLDPVRAPCTVHSFESLAAQKFFDETKLPSARRLRHLRAPVRRPHRRRGTAVPATPSPPSWTAPSRTAKGVDRHGRTHGSQFFLVYRDSTSLDTTPDYTVFGEIDPSGIGILERMAAQGQDGTDKDGGGRPNNPSEIIRVTPVAG